MPLVDLVPEDLGVGTPPSQTYIGSDVPGARLPVPDMLVPGGATLGSGSLGAALPSFPAPPGLLGSAPGRTEWLASGGAPGFLTGGSQAGGAGNLARAMFGAPGGGGPGLTSRGMGGAAAPTGYTGDHRRVHGERAALVRRAAGEQGRDAAMGQEQREASQRIDDARSPIASAPQPAGSVKGAGAVTRQLRENAGTDAGTAAGQVGDAAAAARRKGQYVPSGDEATLLLTGDLRQNRGVGDPWSAINLDPSGSKGSGSAASSGAAVRAMSGPATASDPQGQMDTARGAERMRQALDASGGGKLGAPGATSSPGASFGSADVDPAPDEAGAPPVEQPEEPSSNAPSSDDPTPSATSPEPVAAEARVRDREALHRDMRSMDARTDAPADAPTSETTAATTTTATTAAGEDTTEPAYEVPEPLPYTTESPVADALIPEGTVRNRPFGPPGSVPIDEIRRTHRARELAANASAEDAIAAMTGGVAFDAEFASATASPGFGIGEQAGNRFGAFATRGGGSRAERLAGFDSRARYAATETLDAASGATSPVGAVRPETTSPRASFAAPSARAPRSPGAPLARPAFGEDSPDAALYGGAGVDTPVAHANFGPSRPTPEPAGGLAADLRAPSSAPSREPSRAVAATGPGSGRAFVNPSGAAQTTRGVAAATPALTPATAVPNLGGFGAAAGAAPRRGFGTVGKAKIPGSHTPIWTGGVLDSGEAAPYAPGVRTIAPTGSGAAVGRGSSSPGTLANAGPSRTIGFTSSMSGSAGAGIGAGAARQQVGAFTSAKRASKRAGSGASGYGAGPSSPGVIGRADADLGASGAFVRETPEGLPAPASSGTPVATVGFGVGGASRPATGFSNAATTRRAGTPWNAASGGGPAVIGQSVLGQAVAGDVGGGPGTAPDAASAGSGAGASGVVPAGFFSDDAVARLSHSGVPEFGTPLRGKATSDVLGKLRAAFEDLVDRTDIAGGGVAAIMPRDMFSTPGFTEWFALASAFVRQYLAHEDRTAADRTAFRNAQRSLFADAAYRKALGAWKAGGRKGRKPKRGDKAFWEFADSILDLLENGMGPAGGKDTGGKKACVCPCDPSGGSKKPPGGGPPAQRGNLTSQIGIEGTVSWETPTPSANTARTDFVAFNIIGEPIEVFQRPWGGDPSEDAADYVMAPDEPDVPGTVETETHWVLGSSNPPAAPAAPAPAAGAGSSEDDERSPTTKKKPPTLEELLDEALDDVIATLRRVLGPFAVTPVLRAWLAEVLRPYLMVRISTQAGIGAAIEEFKARDPEPTELETKRFEIEIEGASLRLEALDLDMLLHVQNAAEPLLDTMKSGTLAAEYSDLGFLPFLRRLNTGGDRIEAHVEAQGFRLVRRATALQRRDDIHYKLEYPDTPANVRLSSYTHRWVSTLKDSPAIRAAMDGRSEVWARVTGRGLLAIEEWNKATWTPSDWEQECVDDMRDHGWGFVFAKNYLRTFATLAPLAVGGAGVVGFAAGTVRAGGLLAAAAQSGAAAAGSNFIAQWLDSDAGTVDWREVLESGAIGFSSAVVIGGVFRGAMSAGKGVRAAIAEASAARVRAGAGVQGVAAGTEAAATRAGLGERVGKFFNVFADAADPARRAELTARYIAKGKSAAEARALAAPLSDTAMGEHWIPRSKIDRWIMQLADRGDYRAASALARFRDSPFNVLKPSGISRGEFEELHYLVDPSRHGGSFGPRSAFRFSGAREGLTKYDLLGRAWYGTPTPTKFVIGAGVTATGVGGYEVVAPDDQGHPRVEGRDETH